MGQKCCTESQNDAPITARRKPQNQLLEQKIIPPLKLHLEDKQELKDIPFPTNSEHNFKRSLSTNTLFPAELLSTKPEQFNLSPTSSQLPILTKSNKKFPEIPLPIFLTLKEIDKKLAKLRRKISEETYELTVDGIDYYFVGDESSVLKGSGYCKMLTKLKNFDEKYFEGYIRNFSFFTGLLAQADGQYYYGGFKANKPHGVGEEFKNDSIYKGLFAKGKKSGKGELITEEYRYKGNFMNNEFHGKGELSYDNGDFYRGAFKNGSREGYGKFEFFALKKFFQFFFLNFLIFIEFFFDFVRGDEME
jgi:hypothetical protein